jgi:hypothetical protein
MEITWKPVLDPLKAKGSISQNHDKTLQAKHVAGRISLTQNVIILIVLNKNY